VGTKPKKAKVLFGGALPLRSNIEPWPSGLTSAGASAHVAQGMLQTERQRKPS